MNVASRAHRILRAMVHYRKAEPESDVGSSGELDRLGRPIGRYHNPEGGQEVIQVLSHGMKWQTADREIEVLFSEIADVELTNEKQSKALTLVLKNGDKLIMPVTGQQGRCYDSLEMLRFLRRVMSDLREFGPG